MIHVERSADYPDVLRKAREDEKGENAANSELIDHNTLKPIDPEKKPTYKAYAHDSVRDALRKLFNKKCAYCESFYSHVSDSNIDHWRPKAKYPWLASDWDNLMPSCTLCNQTRTGSIIGQNGEEITVTSGKLDQFPLEDESNRLTWGQKPGKDSLEKPLLLNPCEDHPQEHLEFVLETLGSKKPIGMLIPLNGSKKAEESIKVYALNRSDLVSFRRDYAMTMIYLETQIKKRINNLPDAGPQRSSELALIKDDIEFLRSYDSSDKQFRLLARQVIESLENFLNPLIAEDI